MFLPADEGKRSSIVDQGISTSFKMCCGSSDLWEMTSSTSVLPLSLISSYVPEFFLGFGTSDINDCHLTQALTKGIKGCSPHKVNLRRLTLGVHNTKPKSWENLINFYLEHLDEVAIGKSFDDKFGVGETGDQSKLVLNIDKRHILTINLKKTRPIMAQPCESLIFLLS